MIKQTDISYLSFGLKPVPVMPLETVERLREQLKSRARDINKFEGFVTIADIDDVFGVEEKK